MPRSSLFAKRPKAEEELEPLERGGIRLINLSLSPLPPPPPPPLLPPVLGVAGRGAGEEKEKASPFRPTPKFASDRPTDKLILLQSSVRKYRG